MSSDGVQADNFPERMVKLFEERFRPGSPVASLFTSSPVDEPFEDVNVDPCDAVSFLLNRIVAAYVNRAAIELWAVEARALLETTDPIAAVSVMSVVPMKGEDVPENLLGMLELMLRAARSGSRLGPVVIGMQRLPAETWLSLKAADRRGMTSHELLTIWAARQAGRTADAKIVDASIAKLPATEEDVIR